jgi:hypothetical protein
MHISWIDAKIVPQTLTSIQNALEYSTVPTEIILLLNEQTFIDTPVERPPHEQWDYFMDHPLIPRCTVIRKTDEDEFWGVAKFRREFMNKEGLTYWGESDCMVPLEYFYISEHFDKSQPEDKPWVLSFAVRKMWGGWEVIEHPTVQHHNDHEGLPKGDFMRCDSQFGNTSEERLENLYKFNEEQGEPQIVKLPTSRIEGAITVLKNMPDDLICPDIDFFHEDHNLELMMKCYNIPQYHVSNIIKGHDNWNPDKRTNIDNAMTRNEKAIERKDKNHIAMINYVQSKFASTK